MSSSVLHGSDINGRGLSGSLWKGVPILEANVNPSAGKFLFDDFLSFGGTVTSNVGTYSSKAGGYYSYEDTGGSITQLATEVDGVIRLTTDTSDNDEVWLQSGTATSVFGKFASSGGKKLVFETRVRPISITTRNNYIGFAEEGFAVADAITDAGAMVTTKDFLGFRSLEGDAADYDTVFQKASQTTQVIKDDALTAVASTWYKLGFVFDPNANNTSQLLRYYVDGVLIAGTVTSAILSAATFPDGEEMAPVWGVKNGTTTAVALDVDWWAAWQEN